MNERFIGFVAEEFICSDRFCKDAPSADGIIRHLEKYLSESVVQEIENDVYELYYNLSLYAVFSGMQVAVEIINGTYIHEIH